MRFRLSTFLISTILLAPAYAQGAEPCAFCDSVIQLNDPLKQCFLNKFNDYEKEASQNDFVVIDLIACKGVDYGERGVNQLPDTMEARIKSSYLLDMPSLNCLYKLVAQHKGAFDPVVLFNLGTQCQ